ncbi:MAG: hypothetical protein AAFX87_09840 [Bacteroidota bacterium]
MKTIIQTPTPNLRESIDFYQKLSFNQISEQKPVMVTDGKTIIEINDDRFARAGVKLFRSDWQRVLAELEGFAQVTSWENGYVLSDPSNAWIYLATTDDQVDFEPSEQSYSVLGNNAGLSLETTDMDRSTRIWEVVGFKKNMGSAEQGWISLVNEDGLVISLMKPHSCPHLFFNPSLTYFNGENNPAIIEKIRSLNISITEEITYFNKEGKVDNIIIRDPGGFGFFIFND